MKKNLLNSLKRELMAKFDEDVIKNIGTLVELKLNNGEFMELVGLLNKENVEMVKPTKLNKFYLDKAIHVYGNAHYYFEYDNATNGSEIKQMLFDEFVNRMMKDPVNDKDAVKKNFDQFLNDLKSINKVYQMINNLK